MNLGLSWRRVGAVAALLIAPQGAFATPSATQVDDGTWLNLAPFPRLAHAAAYDPVRRRMMVFGGADPTVRNQLWALNLTETPVWSLIRPGGATPPGSSQLIYDPLRDRLIMFAGAATWELTLSGTVAWNPLTTSGTPPPQLGTTIYDPIRDRVLVFGGSTAAGTNQVYQLSLSGSPAWSELSVTGSPPSPRTLHAAIYDPLRDRMLIVGGETAAQSTNEVWELTLSGTPNWGLIAALGTPPSARSRQTVIYDPPRDRLVMFGGYPFLADEWELSLAGTPTWAQLTPSGASPQARWFHVAIYDPIGDRMIVHGGARSGFAGGAPCDDVWEQALAGSPAWNLMAPAGVSVGTTEDASASYDFANDRILVYRGCTLDPAGQSMWCNDAVPVVLQYDLGAQAMTVVSAGGSPPPGGAAPSVYDAPRERLIVWRGGASLWELSLSGQPAWSALVSSGTPPSSGTVIYDPLRERMLAFGNDVNGVHVWALSLTGPPSWSDLATVGTPPSSRDRFALVYDQPRDRIILFGGSATGMGRVNQVWALALSGAPTWSQLTPSGTPPSGRSSTHAVYDQARERMVVFSGYTGSTLYTGDVWALALNGAPAWTSLAPTGGPARARGSGFAIYDERRDRMVIMTGSRETAFEDIIPISDSWALSWNSLVGVTPGPLPATLSMGVPHPNPASHDVEFSFTSSRTAAWELRAYDLAGRRVVRRSLGTRLAGTHSFRWDLRGENGARMAPGIYVLEMAAEHGERARRRVVVLE